MFEDSLGRLEKLAAQFTTAEQERLYDIARDRAIKGEATLLELVALAADLSVDDIISLGLEPDPDPLVMAAFHRANPSIDPDSLGDKSAEQLQGYVNNTKGLYFEMLFRERANDGETLADFQLREGQRIELDPDQNNPRYDFIVQNADGTIDEELQGKAVSSMKEIHEHFDKYPGTRVVTTSEIGPTAQGVYGEDVLPTNIPNSDVTDRVETQIEEWSEDALSDVIDTTAETVLDAIPLASGLIIIATEGRAVIMGRIQLDEALRRGAKRLGRAAAYTTVGAVLTSTLLPTAPVTGGLVLARILEARLGNRAAMGEIAKEHADALMALTSDFEWNKRLK